jgi:tape measure domain-containing protein
VLQVPPPLESPSIPPTPVELPPLPPTPEEPPLPPTPEDLSGYYAPQFVPQNRNFETPNQQGIYQSTLDQLRAERESAFAQGTPGDIDEAVAAANEALSSFEKNASKYDAAAERVGDATTRDFGRAEKALESFSDSAKKGLGQLIGHRNVDRLSESLGDLATQGRPVEAFFDRLGKTSQVASGGLRFLLENAGNLIKGFVGFYVLDQAGEQLFRFGKAAFDTTQQLNRYRNTLGFVLGDQARGSKEFEFARQEADRLSIPLKVAAEGYTQIVGALKGTRQEGGKAREIFSGLAQTIKAYNLTQEQASSLTTQVGQAFRKQRLQAEEAIIIAESGIPIYQLLQETLGIGAGELADRFQKGEVSADDLGDALVRLKDQTSGAIGDPAINSINAFGNQFTKVKDQIGQGISPAVAQFFKFLGDTLTFLQETMDGLVPVFKFLADAINVVLIPAKFLVDVFGFYLGLVGKIIPPTVLLRAVLVALGSAITVALIPATLAWSTALLALAANTLPALIGVVSAFVLANPALVAAIGAIAVAAAVAKPAVEGLSSALDGVNLKANEAATEFNSEYQNALSRLQKGIPLTKAEMDKLKQGFQENVRSGKDSAEVAETLVRNLERLQFQAENAAGAQKALNQEIEESSKAFEKQSTEIESNLLDRQVAIAEAEATAAARGQLDADRYNADRLEAEQESTADLVGLYEDRANAIRTQLSRISGLGTLGLSDTEIQQQKETREKLEAELLQVEQKGKQARIQAAQKTTAEITGELTRAAANTAEGISNSYEAEGREISRGLSRVQASVQQSLNAREIDATQAAANLAEIDTHRINAEIARERSKIEALAKLPKSTDEEVIAQRAEATATANDRIDQLQLERLRADAAFIKAQDDILALDLGKLEKELSQANEAIEQSQAQRLIDEENLASRLTLNEQQRGDRALSIERERLAEQYLLNQRYIEELRKLPPPNDPEAQEAQQAKIRDAVKRTSDLTLELLRNEAQQNDRLKERIQERLNTQIDLAEQATDAELELLGAFERTLQRQQSLAQQGFDLSQSRLNLAQTELDIQIEQEKDEGKRNRLIQERSELQRQGLLEQQQLARENLDVELRQAEIAARRQKFEAEITSLKARQSQIQAEIELQDAHRSGDADRIESARVLLALTEAQVASAKLLATEAEDGLEDERDRAGSAIETLLNNQESERLRFQFDAQKNIGKPDEAVSDFGKNNNDFAGEVAPSIAKSRDSITELLRGLQPVRLFAGDRAEQSIAAQIGDRLVKPLEAAAAYQQQTVQQSKDLVDLSKRLLSQLQLANGGLNTIADRKPVTVVQNTARQIGSGVGQLAGLNI